MGFLWNPIQAVVVICKKQRVFSTFGTMVMRFFSVIGLLALFLGSVGVPMYEHYCSHEQVTIHTLFSESQHCDSETVSHKDVCCSAEKEQVVQRKNCCSDELKNLSLTFNYFEQLKKDQTFYSVLVPQVLACFIEESTIPNPQNWRYPTVEDPPPLTVHERLPKISCWRL